MRIAMTIHALSGGGAERVFCRLASRWLHAGHDVHAVTWSADDADLGDMPENWNHHGLDLLKPSRSLTAGIWANFNRIRQLRKTLVRIQPELILSFCDQMNISTLQAANGLRVPVWIAERSDPAHQVLSSLRERWRSRVYPQCTGCVAQTEEIATYLSQLVPRDRIRVIPNAVDPPTALSSLSAPDAKIFLSLGRLSREKGVDILLEAWRRTQPQLTDSNWQLYIAGEGPNRSELQRVSAGLSGVHFLGWLDEPQTMFSQASIFVLPSRYEGFPNALLEAMSYGLACISTRCSQAVTELAHDGNAVVVVRAEQADELAGAMVRLANSSTMRKRLGAAAQQVSLGYSWETVGPLWDQILSSRLG